MTYIFNPVFFPLHSMHIHSISPSVHANVILCTCARYAMYLFLASYLENNDHEFLHFGLTGFSKRNVSNLVVRAHHLKYR